MQITANWLSHDGQVLDQVSSTVKIQHPHKATGLQKQIKLIGELNIEWYLRSFNNCTGDWVAEDVMGNRTHVAILFHNQSLLVIRIFHGCKRYINQILGFQRFPTYRAIHCLVLKDKEQHFMVCCNLGCCSVIPHLLKRREYLDVNVKLLIINLQQWKFSLMMTY